MPIVIYISGISDNFRSISAGKSVGWSGFCHDRTCGDNGSFADFNAFEDDELTSHEGALC